MGIHPVAKDGENVESPMPIPILVSAKKSEEMEEVTVQMHRRSRIATTPPSTLSFSSVRRRVRDLALTSPFEICCLAWSLSRPIVGEGIAAFGETMI